MSDNSIIIGLTGDVMIGRTVDTIIGSNGYLYPWGNVLPLFKNADINIINLEAALTYSSKKISKTFNFKASPDRINTLKEASITVVNLANNHVLDFSEKGLRETMQVLDTAGIKYVGAGLNYKHAAHPCILHKKIIFWAYWVLLIMNLAGKPQLRQVASIILIFQKMKTAKGQDMILLNCANW